jgi:hypothetical protein
VEYFHKDWRIEIRSQMWRQLPSMHYVLIEPESILIAPQSFEVEGLLIPGEIFRQCSLIIGCRN